MSFKNTVWDDPVKRAEFIARRNASPGYQNRGAKIRAAALARWTDPKWAKKQRAICVASGKARAGCAVKGIECVIDGVHYVSINSAAKAIGKRNNIISIFVKTGKWPRTREEYLETRRGVAYNGRKVKVGRKTYSSITQAKQATGFGYNKLRKMADEQDGRI